jgi:hypothetical protein
MYQLPPWFYIIPEFLGGTQKKLTATPLWLRI